MAEEEISNQTLSENYHEMAISRGGYVEHFAKAKKAIAGAEVVVARIYEDHGGSLRELRLADVGEASKGILEERSAFRRTQDCCLLSPLRDVP